MRQYIKKADIILLIVLLLSGLTAWAAVAMQKSEGDAAAMVVISSGGSIVGKYPLSEDTELIIPAPVNSELPSAFDESSDECTQYQSYNKICIKAGKISVTEASCKNHVCVKRGAISRPGESIVCLPNRLVVSIEEPKGGDYDSVSS